MEEGVRGIPTVLLLIVSLVMSSCFLLDIAEIFLRPNSTNKEKITMEEATRRVDLYWAMTIKNVDKVKKYMEEGYDPNKSLGEGWDDNTPLNVMAKSYYDTY